MDKVIRLNRFRLIMLLLILVAVSCTPDYDSSVFLTDVLESQGCELPCWHGLIPGQASKEDLLHALEQLPASKVERFQQSEVPNYGTQIWWEDNDIGSTYNALFQENKLIYIESRPAFDITLNDLIEAIGPPDQYIAKLGVGEVYILAAQLFYEKSGVQVTLWTTSPSETLMGELESCASPIPLETTIQNMRIMSPQTAESMINSISILQSNYSVDQLRPWSDEGMYLSDCNE